MTGLGKRAALYLRVSTEDQAREGYSLAAQRDRLQAYCASQDWDVAAVYTDDGYSGKSLERPQLRALIADAGHGRFDVVLVWRLDRLSRRQYDVLHVIENVLAPRSVGFVSATEAFDTSSAAGMAMVGMLSVFAQLERSTILERTRSGYRQRLRQGRWNGRAPYGYRYGPQGILAPDPQKAPWVKTIFDLCVEGLSMRSIAAHLTGAGAPPPTSTWHVRSIEWILHNRAYLGERRTPEGWLESAHPPLVERALFAEAQRAVELRRRHGPERDRQLLAGLLRCPCCDRPMWGQLMRAGGRRKRDYRYYACSNSGGACLRVRAEAAEAAVVDKVLALRLKAGPPELSARRRLADLDRRIDALVGAVESASAAPDSVRRALTRLMDERALLLAAKRPRAAGLAPAAAISARLPELWPHATFAERRALLKSLVGHVRLWPDGRCEVTWR